MTDKDRKPGELPPSQVAVLNEKGQRVGRMGRKAGAPTAARFTNNPSMVFDAKGDCWKPSLTLAEASAAAVGMQPQNTGTNPNATMPPAPKPPSMLANLNAAKGSAKA